MGLSEITLRAVTDEDSRILFSWQCGAGQRQYFRNPHPPTWQEHEEWFTRRANKNIWIIEVSGQQAGMVRLDKVGVNILSFMESKNQKVDCMFEISILVAPDQHGKGIGTAGLELLRTKFPDAVFIAEINQDNRASRALFEKCGYTAVQGNSMIYTSYVEK